MARDVKHLARRNSPLSSATLQALLRDDDPEYICRWHDADRRTLLHYGACHGRADMCQMLLTAVGLGEAAPDGTRPPSLAQGSTTCGGARLLLAADSRGFTPLHYAASWGHGAAMQALLDSAFADGIATLAQVCRGKRTRVTIDGL